MKTDVFPFGPPCRATGSAIDTGAAHGKYKASILRGITGANGLPAAVGIEHAAILNRHKAIVGALYPLANAFLTFKARAQ
jgi:hypothetical protein